MEPSKKKITREQALSAHIECCPYMTAQMGEPISEAGFNKQTARCGLGKLYCIENKCFYIDLFLVVNCFQTLYLWPTDNNLQTFLLLNISVVNCFQTLYLWPTDNNLINMKGESPLLWIAFKLCIFDLLITIVLKAIRRAVALWIAFKLCIFDLLITIIALDVSAVVSCELLSNFVSLTYW